MLDAISTPPGSLLREEVGSSRSMDYCTLPRRTCTMLTLCLQTSWLKTMTGWWKRFWSTPGVWPSFMPDRSFILVWMQATVPVCASIVKLWRSQTQAQQRTRMKILWRNQSGKGDHDTGHSGWTNACQHQFGLWTSLVSWQQDPQYATSKSFSGVEGNDKWNLLACPTNNLIHGHY